MRTLALFLLKLALAAATVAYLAHVVAWEEIVGAARAADARWIGVALALLPINVGLEAWRWHRLVRRLVPDVRLRDTLAAVLTGYPLGLATPGRLGDYVGRAFYLRYAGKWALAALTFAERMATLACTLAVGLAALVLFFLRTDLSHIAWAGAVAVALLGTLAFAWLLLRPRVARRVLALVLPARFAPHLDVLDAFDRRDARSLLALSALRYAVFSTQLWVLVLAFDAAAPLAWTAVGVALVFFAKSAIPSFTLADLGIREGAAIFFLGALGVAEAAAFNAAFLLFCINLLLPSIAGLPLILKLRFAEETREPVPIEVRS